MNAKLALLAERRAHLVSRAAEQRATLAHCVEALRAPLEMVDRGIAVLAYVRRHPVAVIGATTLAIALSPRLAGSWLRRSWLVWRLTRALRNWSRPAAAVVARRIRR